METLDLLESYCLSSQRNADEYIQQHATVHLPVLSCKRRVQRPGSGRAEEADTAYFYTLGSSNDWLTSQRGRDEAGPTLQRGSGASYHYNPLPPIFIVAPTMLLNNLDSMTMV